MLLLGILKDINGNYKNKLFYNWEIWHEATFSPVIDILNVLELKTEGKEYKKIKNNLRDTAKEWQLQFSNSNWSYEELKEIEYFFYKNAKRYGLLKEFRKNGII